MACITATSAERRSPAPHYHRTRFAGPALPAAPRPPRESGVTVQGRLSEDGGRPTSNQAQRLGCGSRTLGRRFGEGQAHPKYIQTQLGHASIQTTLDRYGHLMPDAHAAEARKLDRLVFGDNGHAGAVRATADAVQRLQNGSRNDEGVSGGDR